MTNENKFLKEYTFLQKIVVFLTSYFVTLALKLKYGLTVKMDEKVKKIEGPALYLGTHTSFFDFVIMTRYTFPKKVTFVMSSAFKSKWFSFLCFDWLHMIPKSQFLADTSMVLNVKRAVKAGCSIGLYPEGRMSVTGTTGYFTEALAKFCKSLDLPIVLIKDRGFTLMHPLWSDQKRKGKLESEIRLLYTQDEVRNLSVEELFEGLKEAFRYNEYEWQKENGLTYGKDHLAEHMERILGYCPECGNYYTLSSSGDEITCSHCGKTYRYQNNGEFSDYPLKTIPEWYFNEIDQIKKRYRAGAEFRFSGVVKFLGKEEQEFSEIGAGSLYIDRDKVVLEALGELKVDYTSGKLHTVTGDLSGIYVDIPVKEGLYRFFMSNIHDSGFVMKLIEAQFQLNLESEEGGQQ